ncbi:MAG: MarR family transcriptional regulator [Actinophytocola sp.]|nr:MarR family transcriptional regulator [Actinophytocola sp.]
MARSTKARLRRSVSPETPVVDGDPGSDAVDQAVEQWQRERPDLDPSAMTIFGRIARVFALSRREQARVHEPFGLTHAAFDLLANLRRSGRPHRKTASALAKSSMISTGGVTFRMDGLEDSGLIRRIRDSKDRRVVTAELTDHGMKTIDEAIERHLELFQDMLAGLSTTEQQQLATLLTKLESSIADHLQRQTPAE